MATTEELEKEILAEMAADPVAYAAGPVNDVITIDGESRVISVPASEILFGVETDKDVERKHFRCPRVVGDGIDLSKHQIYISYITSDSTGKSFSGDSNLYLCEDVAIDGDDITFSWQLSGNVFASAGFIAFKVLAAKTDGENVQTRWNTVPAVGTVLMTVPDGMDISETYPDIVTQLLERMESVEKIATEEAMQGYVNTYLEAHPAEIDETLTDPKKAAPADVVGKLKEDIVDLTNGVCSINFDYKYEAIQGEQEPYVFEFYGKSGETYKFENKGIKVDIIFVYTDNTRKTVTEVMTVVEITLEKDCKSFGFYPYESGMVFISVYGDSYKKIMSDVSFVLHEPKNRIAENTDNIEKMLKTYGIKPTIKKSEIFVDSNYELIDGGVCIYNNKYELRVYAVEGNQLIFVKSNERYQFQNDKDIPTSDNAHLIGEQFVGYVNGLIRVPQGATYLIVSSIKTSENGIYAFEPINVNFNESKYYKKDVFISVNDKKWFDGLDLTYDDFNESTTVEQYFTKMNALVDSFSWRMTKENLGKDASGNYDIWGYVYSPFDMPEASYKRPRIIITSCHHGFERGSAFELYYLMYLFKNKKSNSIIKELACSVEICFIPIVNPWGWEQYTPVNTDNETNGRNNFNGVDLNRGYSLSALQPEQIIVKNFVDKYKSNAILFIDHHVNGGSRYSASTTGQRIWLDSDDYECGSITRKINSSFINYWSVNAADLYGGMIDALLGTQTYTSEINNGYATYNGDSNGIMSLTFETVFKLSKTLDELEKEKEFNPNVNKLNTIALVNLIDHYLVSLSNMFMSN